MLPLAFASFVAASWLVPPTEFFWSFKVYWKILSIQIVFQVYAYFFLVNSKWNYMTKQSSFVILWYFHSLFRMVWTEKCKVSLVLCLTSIQWYILSENRRLHNESYLTRQTSNGRIFKSIFMLKFWLLFWYIVAWWCGILDV